jgi:hypothetical protein
LSILSVSQNTERIFIARALCVGAPVSVQRMLTRKEWAFAPMPNNTMAGHINLLKIDNALLDRETGYLSDSTAYLAKLMPRYNHDSFSGEAQTDLSLSDKRQQAARISRRQLLQAGGIGALTLGLPGMIAAGVESKRGLGGGAAEKSCIFILLCGGPSHLDTWDLKPEAPAEIRGPYKPIATKVPGMRLCELHPRLATLTKHFTLIRSMTHLGNISNHFDAMHHCLSGQAEAPLDSPYIGSILAKVRPSQRTIAPYVWLIKCVGDPVFCAPNIGSGGHLGMAHSPLFVGSATNHPALTYLKHRPTGLSDPADQRANFS